MLQITTENRLGQCDTKTGSSLRLIPDGLYVDGELWQPRTSEALILEVKEVE